MASFNSWRAVTWLYPQMETFSALLALCAGNSPVTGEFPSQRPVTRSFDVFFDLCLNKGLSKQSWGWWFDTPTCPLWRHCNDDYSRSHAILRFMVWHSLIPILQDLTHNWGLDNTNDFLQFIFFCKIVVSWFKFHRNLFPIVRSNYEWASIGLDNVLAPNRQQALIWTVDGLAYWCKYAPLVPQKLTWLKRVMYDDAITFLSICDAFHLAEY